MRETGCFAHNGVIGDVPKLEQHLGESMELVAGESDSERFFALITGEIDGHDGSVGAGIGAAARWVVQILPVVSINFVLVTATDMWALRYPQTNTLFVLDRAIVVVASEQMDEDPGWREVRSGELLHVGPSLTLESEILFEGPPAHSV